MDDFDYRTRYRKPVTSEARDAHDRVRGVINDAMRQLSELMGESRERSLMMTKLEEAMFWANAGIARQQGSEGGKES